jgi:hypothetical protein
MRLGKVLDEKGKYGSEDSPITGYAMNRISGDIATTFIRIQYARKLVSDSREYRYCSAFPEFKLDSWPSAAKAAIFEGASIGTSGTRALPDSRNS